MKWRQGRRSSNVEDRRGRRFPLGAGGTFGGGVKLGGGGLLLIVVLALLLGQDPLYILETVGVGGGGAGGPMLPDSPQPPISTNDEEADFVSVILADTEDTWASIFTNELGRRYDPPNLVLFTDMVESACGFNSAAVGPFYCPGDNKVYIDLGFFNELARLGGRGDFAQAYVLAHEVGHHVQNLLGTSRQVSSLQQRTGQEEANALSVLLELQADCYAGVWAHYADQQRQLLESGDVEEGLAAAAAIGDDRLLKRAGRAVSPESFTHGTSEQRAYWLRMGLSSGSLEACNTFSR